MNLKIEKQLKRKQPELHTGKRKYNQMTNQQMANSLSGQFNSGNNPPQYSQLNNYQNLNQQLMTPSQILSANNALGNQLQYQVNNGNNQNQLGQIKNAFTNNLDFNIDKSHNIISDDPESAQNFYNQIQFQNYRMYQPFQIQQPPYFTNSLPGNNTATTSLNTGINGNDIHQSSQNRPHINNHQNIGQNQHMQNHSIQQSLMHDNVFHNQQNPNQHGLPFIDMFPHPNSNKDDRDTIKQTIGIRPSNEQQYFMQDNTQKKRKQY